MQGVSTANGPLYRSELRGKIQREQNQIAGDRKRRLNLERETAESVQRCSGAVRDSNLKGKKRESLAAEMRKTEALAASVVELKKDSETEIAKAKEKLVPLLRLRKLLRDLKKDTVSNS